MPIAYSAPSEKISGLSVGLWTVDCDIGTGTVNVDVLSW